MKKMRLRGRKKLGLRAQPRDLKGLMCQRETEQPSRPHRGPGAFEKAEDAQKDQRMAAVMGLHAQHEAQAC